MKFKLSIALVEEFPPGKIPLIASGIEVFADADTFATAMKEKFETDCLCMQFTSSTAINIGFLAPLVGSIKESYDCAEKSIVELLKRFDDQEKKLQAA
jgi:hypothetical protein